MTDHSLETCPDWVRTLTPETLDDFVTYIDTANVLNTPAMDVLQQTVSYQPGVKVDQTLDPCSDAYHEQMIALYEEISGRSLNQSDGELTPFNLADHVTHANPAAFQSPNVVAQHARAINTAIMGANPPVGARVIDLGCGWGQTTEALHFAAMDVTAVDISPDFVDLVARRADRMGRDIKTICSNFDDLVLDETYDLAFFYECLHHAVKPWDTLKCVTDAIATNGRIVFAGEPVNDFWWKDWGLRLDAVSLYCIRKFGWFESGWSEPFLHRMFRDLGWSLYLVPHVGLNNGYIGFAHRNGDPAVPPLALPLTVLPEHDAEQLRKQHHEATQQLSDVQSQIDGLKQEVQTLTDALAHARRFPWKNLGHAWSYSREKRRKTR